MSSGSLFQRWKSFIPIAFNHIIYATLHQASPSDCFPNLKSCLNLDERNKPRSAEDWTLSLSRLWMCLSIECLWHTLVPQSHSEVQSEVQNVKVGSYWSSTPWDVTHLITQISRQKAASERACPSSDSRAAGARREPRMLSTCFHKAS